MKELFNSFFANKCSLIKNTSELPTNCESLTEKSLSNIFADNDIGKIIKGLDFNEAHNHDVTSIFMLKLCAASILQTFTTYFQNFFRSMNFPLMFKKSQRCPYS